MISAAFLDHLLQTYGYGLVFGVICLESMGLPLPGESLIIAAGLYAATTGKLWIVYVIAAAAAGAIIGDNIGYLLGRWAGFPLLKRYGSYVGLNDKRMQVGQYLFKAHGGKVVFTGRFIAILRTFVALLAGASHMEWKTFLLWNAVGGVAWTVLYGAGAYLLGDAVHRVEGPLAIVMGVVGVTVAIVSVVVLRRNEKRLEGKAEAAMRTKDAG